MSKKAKNTKNEVVETKADISTLEVKKTRGSAKKKTIEYEDQVKTLYAIAREYGISYMGSYNKELAIFKVRKPQRVKNDESVKNNISLIPKKDFIDKYNFFLYSQSATKDHFFFIPLSKDENKDNSLKIGLNITDRNIEILTKYYGIEV